MSRRKLPGSDKAPSPSETLLAVLDSSLAMGIHASAIARDIIVHRLALDLEGDTHPAGAVGTLGSAPRVIGFDVIRVTVILEANAPRELLSAAAIAGCQLFIQSGPPQCRAGR
jgi:hypothetical protein